MQTCSRCNTQSPDSASACQHCSADLKKFSTVAVALANLKANPRVSQINVLVASDACPACIRSQGVYAKDQVPILPHEGCSHAHGCRCFYEPVLTEIFP